MQIPFWANLGAKRFWTFMSVLTLRQSGIHMFCQDASDSKPPLMVSGCLRKHATAMQQPHRAQGHLCSGLLHSDAHAEPQASHVGAFCRYA